MNVPKPADAAGLVFPMLTIVKRIVVFLAAPVVTLTFVSTVASQSHWDVAIGTPGFSDSATAGLALAMTVFDDGQGGGPALYTGGRFDTAGGLSANRIAKWDGAQWSPLGSGVTGGGSTQVLALAVFDDGQGGGPALYVGGIFATAGGVAASNVAKWDGQQWSNLGSGLGGINDPVRALAVFDDGQGGGPALYAGGLFTNSGATTVNYMAKWSPGTQTWSSVGGGMAGAGNFRGVYALRVFDDGQGGGPALYAGGQFTTAGGVSANRIARWNGVQWSALGSGVAGGTTYPRVYVLEVFDDGGGSDALYAGGEFATAGGVAAKDLARWDGQTWSALSGGTLNGGAFGVLALEVHDDGTGDALYVGTSHPNVDALAINYIGKWGGTSWSPLASGVDGWVEALLTYDYDCGPELIVGGRFFNADGQTAGRIAKWTDCPCQNPIQITYMGGREDNFVAPPEPAFPSADLLATLQNCSGGPLTEFDPLGVNQCFGHTFTGLPLTIVSAQLEIHMKARGPNADNDNLSLQLLGSGTFAWTGSIATLTGLPWRYGDEATVTLDLGNLPPGGTNILDQINSSCSLDVRVADDTGIDYAKLTVTVCPCDSPDLFETHAGDQDNFASSGDPADVLVIRQEFADWLSRPNGNNDAYHGGNPLPFDIAPDGFAGTTNWDFGYTFTNLSAITSATLTIGLKAGINTSAGNDAMRLQFLYDNPPAWSWGWNRSIADLDAFMGGDGVWSPGEDLTVTVDLSQLPLSGGGTTDLIPIINADGYLDVGVADDTGVDYIILQLATCSCCPCGPYPSDLDGDGDVDGNDFLTFSNCFNGALNPPTSYCENPCADLDGDGDVDVNDFLTFSNCFNGALRPPACPPCP